MQMSGILYPTKSNDLKGALFTQSETSTDMIYAPRDGIIPHEKGSSATRKGHPPREGGHPPKTGADFNVNKGATPTSAAFCSRYPPKGGKTLHSASTFCQRDFPHSVERSSFSIETPNSVWGKREEIRLRVEPSLPGRSFPIGQRLSPRPSIS